MTAHERIEAGSARAMREEALRQTRRRLVLDAAWTVFTQNGLDGPTVRAIAAAAGCTTGAIYPLFPSKEAIYAALLAESLTRLRDAVAAAVGAQSSPQSALKAGALAFLAYYRSRPDEVALGLYLWNGVRPRGLSRELDQDLNRRLVETLDLLRGALLRLGDGIPAKGDLTETAMLFAFLIGALVVHGTGRLGTLGSDLDAIANAHVDALVARLGERASECG